jgi:hypothetical protein
MKRNEARGRYDPEKIALITIRAIEVSYALRQAARSREEIAGGDEAGYHPRSCLRPEQRKEKRYRQQSQLAVPADLPGGDRTSH